jgi:hypothetical protein
MLPNFPNLICQDHYVITVQSKHVKTHIKYAKIIKATSILMKEEAGFSVKLVYFYQTTHKLQTNYSFAHNKST